MPRDDAREIAWRFPRARELAESEDGRERAWGARLAAAGRERDDDCGVAPDDERIAEPDGDCLVEDCNCPARARFELLSRELVRVWRSGEVRPCVSAFLAEVRSGAVARALFGLLSRDSVRGAGRPTDERPCASSRRMDVRSGAARRVSGRLERWLDDSGVEATALRRLVAAVWRRSLSRLELLPRWISLRLRAAELETCRLLESEAVDRAIERSVVRSAVRERCLSRSRRSSL